MSKVRANKNTRNASKTGQKAACIIGAGLGGLALAIRLQGAGVQTTIIEARDAAGGQASFWQKSGTVFDAGPTMITDPNALRVLWEETGHDLDDDLELMWVDPHFRLNWPDGTTFDLAADADNLRAEIRRLSPPDIEGHEAFTQHLRDLAKAAPRHNSGRLSKMRALIAATPDLPQSRSWQSLYAAASRFFSHEKLAQAFSFHAMLSGVNPIATGRNSGALLAPYLTNAERGGLYWVRGGMGRLVAAMTRHFERLGGRLSLGDRVVKIEMDGNLARGVTTKSGWSGHFDLIVNNGDPVHAYRDLLSRHQHGWKTGKRLAQTPRGFSAFVVHFGVEGTWPGIPHHMALFGKGFEDLFADISGAGVLPEDMLIYLHHPTITDPSMAPAGKSSFTAMIPVPHLGKMAVDWDLIGESLEKRILDEIGRRLIPDIHDRITARFHYSPKNFAADFGAHLGCAFGPEPSRGNDSAMTGNRDSVISNFYHVGAWTHPQSQNSGGISKTIISADDAATQILRDLAKPPKTHKKPKKSKNSKK